MGSALYLKIKMRFLLRQEQKKSQILKILLNKVAFSQSSYAHGYCIHLVHEGYVFFKQISEDHLPELCLSFLLL